MDFATGGPRNAEGCAVTGPGLDDWDEQFPGMPILRRPPEPIEVMVDVSRALPAGRGFTRVDGLPLRVRAGGIRLESVMRASLHAWIRVCDGRWLAQVRLPVRSSSGRSGAELWLWVDSVFVFPAGEGAQL